MCCDVEPQVASIEMGNVAFWLTAGVPVVEGDIMVLVEVELGFSRLVEEVVDSMVMVVRDVDSESVFVTTDTGRMEPNEV